MAARRAFTLAMPASDPRSARIWAYLEALDPEADSSAELRALICEAFDQVARLDRIDQKLDADHRAQITVALANEARLATIEAKLDQIAAVGVVAVSSAEPPDDPPIDPAIIADLLSFDPAIIADLLSFDT